MEGWKEAFIASLGGGLIYQVTDSILSTFLGGYPLAAGITLKDVALILLTKYGADRTRGMLSEALKGATVIGLYRIIYERFVSPSVSSMVASIPGSIGSGSGSGSSGKNVEDAARSWIMKAFRSGLYRV